MNRLALLGMALSSLAHHKVRSALTALGVVFGVGAVVAMLAISAGARGEALRQIEGMGLDNIIVRSVAPIGQAAVDSASDQVLSYGLERRDRAGLIGLSGIRGSVASRSLRLPVQAAGQRVDARVMAVEADFAAALRLQISRGRLLGGPDEIGLQAVCILGSTLARDLVPLGDALGATVWIGPEPFLVVGILAPSAHGAPTLGLAASDIDRACYLPFPVARARFGEVITSREAGAWRRERVVISDLILRLEAGADPVGVGGLVRRLLAGLKPGRQDTEVVVPLELLEASRRTQAIFAVVMGSIAGISLLVGGIGIMNIMLATVLERTREIGVRRAVGARRADIVAQFLAEAVVLCAAGGLVGLLAGIGGAALVGLLAGWPVEVTTTSVWLSFGISVLVGVIFGTWPAIRAARLDPVTALRSE